MPRRADRLDAPRSTLRPLQDLVPASRVHCRQNSLWREGAAPGPRRINAGAALYTGLGWTGNPKRRRIGYADPAVTPAVDVHIFAGANKDAAAVLAIEAAMAAKR